MSNHRCHSHHALAALLLVVGLCGSVTQSHAQNRQVFFGRFGSLGIHYPVNTDPKHPRTTSLQGGVGETFTTTVKPSSAQFGVQSGFARTKFPFAYHCRLELGDFLNAPPLTLDKIPVHVLIYSGIDRSVVEEQEGFVEPNGDFIIFTDANPAPLIDGVPYPTEISLKAPHWLRQHLTPLAPAAAEGYPTAHFSLINGDANGDNVVDTKDNVFVAHHMKAQLGEPKYDSNADLNGDAKVTPLDLQIVHANRGIQGDE